MPPCCIHGLWNAEPRSLYLRTVWTAQQLKGWKLYQQAAGLLGMLMTGLACDSQDAALPMVGCHFLLSLQSDIMSVQDIHRFSAARAFCWNTGTT